MVRKPNRVTIEPKQHNKGVRLAAVAAAMLLRLHHAVRADCGVAQMGQQGHCLSRHRERIELQYIQ